MLATIQISPRAFQRDSLTLLRLACVDIWQFPFRRALFEGASQERKGRTQQRPKRRAQHGKGPTRVIQEDWSKKKHHSLTSVLSNPGLHLKLIFSELTKLITKAICRINQTKNQIKRSTCATHGNTKEITQLNKNILQCIQKTCKLKNDKTRYV